MTVNYKHEIANIENKTVAMKSRCNMLIDSPDQWERPDIANWIASLRSISASVHGSMTTLLTAGMTDGEIGSALGWRPVVTSPQTLLAAVRAAGDAVVDTYRSSGLDAEVASGVYGLLPEDGVSPHPVMTSDITPLRTPTQALLDALPV